MTLSVERALAGRRVLITGTTGFVGKALLEKLLRDVPSIGELVLLLRGDATHPCPTERLHAQVLGSSVFDHLRRESPAALSDAVAAKVCAVAGAITEPDLGLSPEAFDALAQRIDVVIHVAASVDFREALDRAIATNAISVGSLAKLARRANGGQGVPLLQVSTCYVNGYHRGTVTESLAPPARAKLAPRPDGSYDVQPLIARLLHRIEQVKRRLPERQAQARALVALGIREAQRLGWNDTYTFTKWLGEQLAWQAMDGGTLAIVRPSIVESACREPQPGWIEGMKVGDAIVLAYARGKTRLFPARPAGVADIIPVDLVVNGIVLAAVEALSRPGARRIYQACSGSRNPIRVGDYVRLCQAEMRANSAAYPRLIRKPLDKPFRTVPRLLFLGWLGAACALATVARHVSRWIGAHRLHRVCEALATTRQLATTFSFYTSPRYVFDNRGLLALAERFSAEERARFEIDPRCFDWANYIARVHLPGLERYAVRGS
jgi:fatty acyl-CoA reductase